MRTRPHGARGKVLSITPHIAALPLLFFVEWTLLSGSNDSRHLSSSGLVRHLLSLYV